ncbi:MAG TPA: ABC transporter ATP-binding protein [Stellaceae bacterium]|nr:ABC transporter ATP-binding protein [Stellaceae bacterium]
MGEAAPLLRIEDLRVAIRGDERRIQILQGVSLDLARGEVLCLLGESGSGKSVTLRSMLRLLPAGRTTIEGRILFDGQDLLELPLPALSDLRGRRIAMIFQEPATAFDPVYTIGRQIVETIRRHEAISARDAFGRARELLDRVQIPSPERRLQAYPHELSGGMRQRAMIALALACRPALLLADEPTTALDATVQIQILLLLRRLQQELGLAIIFVTHDIGVAVEIADRIAVMYAGRIVESGPVRDILRDPGHPYTQGLLASTLRKGERGRRLAAIPGAPPDLAALPPGCAFAPRCDRAEAACAMAVPPLVRPSAERWILCRRPALRGDVNGTPV